MKPLGLNTRRRLAFCVVLALLFAVLAAFVCPLFQTVQPETRAVFYTGLGQPKSLDPIHAADYASCVMGLSLYDTLFAYDYAARPYRVKPSMLAQMPDCSPDGLCWRFTLRGDLLFQPDSCFTDQTARRVKASDVCFSLLRLADPRLRSSGYSVIRNRIAGLEAFRSACAGCAADDFSPYESGCAGLRVRSDTQFEMLLEHPDPRLPFYLAMPYTAVVSETYVRAYGQARLNEAPLGSGPFQLREYVRDYRLMLARYPAYRREYFDSADSAYRSEPLPYLERIVCYLVQDPQPAWLMFLKNELDVSVIGKDQLGVVGSGRTLPPEMTARGIRLLTAPEFQINYIGFSFSDKRLRENLTLRRALSLAYNKDLRVQYYAGLVEKAYSPVPGSVEGALPDTACAVYAEMDLDRARSLLAEAGYPDGVDSVTGEPLTFTFDLPETGPAARQLGEMMVRDYAKIGVRIMPLFNSKAKFIERNRTGQMQLFRFNWVGDYPDAENFFQLFYSPNVNQCNRAGFSDPRFDALFESAVRLSPGPDRTRAYEEMNRYLTAQCPWICESSPLSFRLIHPYVHHYRAHDFAFDRWKYLAVDTALRETCRAR